MCLRHWRLVPIEHQRTINTRFRALRRDFAFLSDVAYLSACVAAIDHIAVAEGKSGRNAYAGLLASATRRSEGSA